MKRLLAISMLLAAGCSSGSHHTAPPVSQSHAQPCSNLTSLKPAAGSIFYQVGSIAVNLPVGQSCVFPDGTEVENTGN